MFQKSRFNNWSMRENYWCGYFVGYHAKVYRYSKELHFGDEFWSEKE